VPLRSCYMSSPLVESQPKILRALQERLRRRLVQPMGQGPHSSRALSASISRAMLSCSRGLWQIVALAGR